MDKKWRDKINAFENLDNTLLEVASMQLDELHEEEKKKEEK